MIKHCKNQVYKSAISLSLGIIPSVVLTLVLIAGLAADSAALSVNHPVYSTTKEKDDFGSQGRPPTTGGGSRGECPIALENSSSESVRSLIGANTNSRKTTLAHPTFWFHIPYVTKEPLQGDFELQDAQENPILKISFTTPRRSGYVSIPIPETEKALEVGKEYRWYFYLYCDNKKPLTVSGRITRVNVTPEMQAQLKLPQNQSYQVYWDNLIWYDAIAALAELRLNNPQDPNLTQEWARLLQSAELSLPNTPPVGSVVITP